MAFEGEAKDQSASTLVLWEAERHLRELSANEARLSRGFLRSHPASWFPGFAAHWLPLTHSLSIEIKLIEVRPVVNLPAAFDYSFVASVDQEPIGLGLSFDSARNLLDAIVPGGSTASEQIVLEYLARRLITSLGLCWSGPESTAVRFEPRQKYSNMNVSGGVKLALHVNGKSCEVWLALGQVLISNLDALWRRQLQATNRQGSGTELIHLEIVRLAVPPSMLSEYLKPGTVIDLEVPVSDQILLRSSTGPWIQARLCNIEGRLGCEALPGPAQSKAQPEGTTALHIQFGSVQVERSQLSELGQFGAVWDTGLALGAPVQMLINDEVVSNGTLCVYEGRFAVSVNPA